MVETWLLATLNRKCGSRLCAPSSGLHLTSVLNMVSEAVPVGEWYELAYRDDALGTAERLAVERRKASERESIAFDL